ncbi:CHAT domain-containing protein [Aquincola sp. S2]|uniref:CHAT domain-containing protein n=1 Tax=Pseudaquabacterium terrae TaxID=2732868 RepID=A0ABX2E9U3_9BURK|nr:CHAT domain-containing protein [Aquabacterium terrae]NRF65781.1 CHAT domain-containing protein [Aquabacterium terrae]
MSRRAKAPTQAPAAPATTPLQVSVCWGDMTRSAGDVLLVGHYAGVMPQRAELAVDDWVSATAGGGPEVPRLITEMTRRGVLRGDLGEVQFFPGPDGRLAAVAGMGQPGTFGPSQQRRLATAVAQVIGMLPQTRSVTSVVIGSGEGNLPLELAARDFVDAFAGALQADPRLKVRSLAIAERQLERALQVQRALAAAPTRPAATRQWTLADGLQEVDGGGVSADFGCAMLLAALGLPDDGKPGLLESALQRLPESLRDAVRQRIRGAQANGQPPEAALRHAALQLRLAPPEEPVTRLVPTRMAFTHRGDDLHATAITERTTVTERVLERRVQLALRAAEKLAEASTSSASQLGQRIRRLLVHGDLQSLLQALGDLVLELDEVTASMPWEMLALEGNAEPLAVRRPLARQLRTRYSPRPGESVRGGLPRVLIIGDPASGTGALPSARVEAKELGTWFKEHEVDCTVLIGPPEAGTGAGTEAGYEPAEYVEVVTLLQSGQYDIVHFCGHADYEQGSAERCGWLFDENHRLTGSDLQGMARPPRLVFANACLTSQIKRGNVAAGLADEFFHVGVQDFIGTAWEVPSEPARTLAMTFYRELLPAANRLGAPIGEALREARAAIWQPEQTAQVHAEGAPRAAWAAYQHYGDPASRFVTR